MKYIYILMAFILSSSGPPNMAKAQNKENHHQAHSQKPKLHKNQTHNIIIERIWARASIGKTGAAFLTILNKGKSEDKLIKVISKIANRAELHTHIQDGDIMRMRHVKHVPIPPNGLTILKPGGFHIMFMGLKQKLTKSDQFLLTLVFEKAGKIHTQVAVKHMGALNVKEKHHHGAHKEKH
ncbi:MAG: copper chaperone PCu(A)C [Pseudomonadota bacterium]|nr:copper chaperone PCu(A)C [Pseudomonadota bacterium]